MIDDVLKDVREAEAKADEMLKRAYQRGKDIVLKAEADAEAEKKSTVSECKEDRAKILENAREQAAEKTAMILQRGAENAEYFIQEKQPAVEECADKVVKILLSKYIVDDEQPNADTEAQADGQAEAEAHIDVEADVEADAVGSTEEQSAEQSVEQINENINETNNEQNNEPNYQDWQ